MSKYEEWIEQNVVEPYGQCREKTLEMLEAFPELFRVRGHYMCLIWGEREHWWLVDPQGVIVDPTKSQFPSKGIGEYVPWDESQEEPTGMCPNCGGLCYGGNCCCSERCGIEYAAYCMNG